MRYEYILENGDEDLIYDVNNGLIEINTAYEDLKRVEEVEEVDEKVDTQILTDIQIMEEYNWPIRPYDVWNFQRTDKAFSSEHSTPAQLIANALYFFTKQGSIVIDPMAGSGVVGEVCKRMQRRYKMYDINPTRNDIQKLDITKGFPNVKADLVFWDPPYHNKLDYGQVNKRVQHYFLPFNELIVSWNLSIRSFIVCICDLSICKVLISLRNLFVGSIVLKIR
jgi:DNA modification methylase